MGCSRCGANRPQRQVPPPSVTRPGTQVPRPAQPTATPDVSNAIRDAISNMRLPYVPPTASR